jgi:hypothetical protein
MHHCAVAVTMVAYGVVFGHKSNIMRAMQNYREITMRMNISVAIIAGLLAGTPAIAATIPTTTPDRPLADAHTFDGTVVLKDDYGKDALQCAQFSADGQKCEKTEPMTLADALRSALLSSYRDEPNLDGPEKFKRWYLANKITNNPKAVALSLKDAALVEKLVGKAFSPVIVGQIYIVIDPNYPNQDVSP